MITEEKTTIEDFLFSFDQLIQKLNVSSVEKNPNLNANVVFSKDPSTGDEKGKSEENKIKQVEIFLNKLENVKFPGNALQYSRITQTMFNHNQKFDGVENVSQRLLDITLKHYEGSLDNNGELERRFYKLIDHIQLASFQIGEISQHTRTETDSLKSEIAESKNNL